MVYYAVIDTNVFISALLSKRADAATVRVLDAMFDGKIVPLYHGDILAEYDEVLHRSKFHFKEETIRMVINAVKQYIDVLMPPMTLFGSGNRAEKKKNLIDRLLAYFERLFGIGVITEEDDPQ